MAAYLIRTGLACLLKKTYAAVAVQKFRPEKAFCEEV
jgi:hypothetical protein